MSDAIAIIRAQLADAPDDLLLAECARRGWVVERVSEVFGGPDCPCYFCRERRARLPFEVEE